LQNSENKNKDLADNKAQKPCHLSVINLSSDFEIC
jgi:hypothetical protein